MLLAEPYGKTEESESSFFRRWQRLADKGHVHWDYARTGQVSVHHIWTCSVKCYQIEYRYFVIYLWDTEYV